MTLSTSLGRQKGDSDPIYLLEPAQNVYCESFNGKLRIECLRQHWFKPLNDARQVIEDWRLDYNHVRPHNALGQMAPIEALLTTMFKQNSHSEYSG